MICWLSMIVWSPVLHSSLDDLVLTMIIFSLPGEWREWRVHGDSVKILFILFSFSIIFVLVNWFHKRAKLMIPLPNQQICQYAIIQKMQTSAQVNFIKICQTNKYVNMQSYKKMQVSAQVNFIKICQTNKVLVTASLDGSFCLWDIKQVNTGV